MKILSPHCFSMLVALGIGLDAAAQPTWHNLDPGENAVGFRLFRERDDTRVVPDRSGRSDQARIVRVYFWYPAVTSPSATSMHFGRYASLADDDAWPYEAAGSLREKLSFSRHAFARSLGAEGFEALRSQPVRAVEDAEPLKGPFPLIVVGQGLYYESPIAFAALSEYLAGRGFAVATCPLVGTHAPIVKLDVEDLETQVRDLEVVIARAREFPYVSPEKLGVIGFDMGGMAGLILAMRNASVDAFASIPAGILFPHPSGLPAASPDYGPSKLRIPWLHVGPRREAPPTAQTASLFDTAVHAERYHLQIDGLEHVDSTSYALVEGRNAIFGYWPAWEADSLERHKILGRYVAEFFSAFLTNRPESLAFLKRALDQTEESSIAMAYRPATPGTLTYDDLVDALLTGDAAAAIDEVRDLRTNDPSSILLDDFYLYRLAYSLLYSWALRDEALQLSRLNVELNPTSTLATQGLSMSYVDRGDYDAAVEVYRQLLEKRPDDEGVRRTLEWLKGQLERSKQKN